MLQRTYHGTSLAGVSRHSRMLAVRSPQRPSVISYARNNRRFAPKVFLSIDRTLFRSYSNMREGPPVAIASAAAHGRIHLDPSEKRVFEYLLDACKQLGLQTELRVAGGWVRDKLLGLPCTDIDIAVDDISGERFALQLLHYSAQRNDAATSRSVNTTKLDPAQSKHLETAIISIYDMKIDVAQLRSDTYASDSRIPIIRSATPMQDALRRDLTINSLFYNIHTDCIEDWCGRGLTDLAARLICTPLDPDVTLSDDPLRALRLIRFASKLEFNYETRTFQALKQVDPTCLRRKVSRERIGIELRKMLQEGSRSSIVLAMKHITEFRLYNVVFQDNDSRLWPHAKALEGLRRVEFIASHMFGPLFGTSSPEDKSSYLVIAYLSPFLSLKTTSRSMRIDAKNTFDHLFKNILKWPSKSAHSGIHFWIQSHRAIDMLDLVFARSSNASDASSIGVVLQLWWKICFNSSSPDALMTLENSPTHWIYKTGPIWALCLLMSRCLRPEGLSAYATALDAAAHAELEFIKAATPISERPFEPILTGDDLIGALHLSPSKKIGVLLHYIDIWRAHHPTGTREDALQFARFLLAKDICSDHI